MTITTSDDVAVPAGTWLRDEHATAPLPALQSGCWIEPLGTGFRAAMARYGLPAVGLEHLLHRGWVYARFVPLTDPAALADRIATRMALPEGSEAAAAARWIDEALPAWARRRRLLRAGVEALPDADLADRLVDIAAGMAELVEQRFTDIPVSGLLGRWVALAGERLGWDEATAAAGLGGRSSAATSVLRAVRDARERGLADDELVATHGDLLLGGNVLDPTLAERLDLVAELGAATDTGPSAVDEAAWPRFDDVELATAFADARLAVQWREGTHDELAAWLGALRNVALEAGRRLVAAGVLGDGSLVLHLTVEEVAAGLRGAGAGLGARAEAQAAVHQRSVDDPPPPLLGPPPMGPPAGGPPLPREVAQPMADMSWVAQRMGAPPGPPVVVDGAVSGVGASPGSVTGRVRVVLDVAELGAFEPDEILVCPMTAPGWDLAIAVAAAVVTDTGGLVSHSALLARELGIPAVVGTKVGTSVLRTGQTVVVDGAAGTVTITA